MRSKSVGKLLVLSSLAIFSLLACNPNKGSSGNTKIYRYDDNYRAVDTGATINLTFYNVANLPYVCINDYLNIFTDNTITLTNTNNNVFTFTNNLWNGKSYTSDNISAKKYNATATFNFNNNTMTYGDYTCFVNLDEYALNPVDVVCGEGIFEDEECKVPMFKRKKDGNIYFAGDEKTIDLDDYNIVTKVVNNKLYLPLYTAKTLFTSDKSSFFYNGKALYMSLPNVGYDYNYTIADGMFYPTTAYLEYAYNQLALDLDIRFGLKGFTRQNHYNGGTTKYPTSGYDILGNKSNYTSSPAKFDEQLMSVVGSKLDDGGHTGFTGYSYFTETSPSYYYGDETMYKYESYYNIEIDRGNSTYSKEYKQDIPYSYSKVYGSSKSNPKTLTLRLDDFDTDNKTGNGFLNIIYFIRAINNYNATHIVIDLSCNGGGYVFMQYLLTYYLTSGKSQNYVKNSFNGSHGYVAYDVDSNFNGTIGDSGDTLPSDVTTIDILTSNFTFSAANTTACYLKDANSSINFYGERSGGGICCVDQTMITPLGLTSQWSSPTMLTYSDYGSEKDIDKGVTPTKTPTWDSHDLTASAQYKNYYLTSLTPYPLNE